MGPTEAVEKIEDNEIHDLKAVEKIEDNEIHDLKAIEAKHLEIMGDINILGDILSLENKYGRNNLCFCNSGKKFKKCCLIEHEQKERKMHHLLLDIKDVQMEYSILKAHNIKIEKQNKYIEECDKVNKEVLNTSNNTSKKDGDTSG